MANRLDGGGERPGILGGEILLGANATKSQKESLWKCNKTIAKTPEKAGFEDVWAFYRPTQKEFSQQRMQH